MTRCQRTLCTVSAVKFGQLILRKIIKIVVAICQILRVKFTKVQFRLELCPRPRWESLQRSHRPLAGFNGAYF